MDTSESSPVYPNTSPVFSAKFSITSVIEHVAKTSLNPFFFKEADWIPVPADWETNIVQGKTYDTDDIVGNELGYFECRRLNTSCIRAAPLTSMLAGGM